MRRIDMGVIDVFIFVPPVAAVAWLLLLSGAFNEGAGVVLWALFFLALRPLIWLWASQRDGIEPRRKRAYAERQRYSTNTSFAFAAIIGLVAFDVLGIPGGPFWANQPRASFAMVPVVVYLTWLAFRADIPAEVAWGYRRLFGRKDGPEWPR